MAEKFVVLNIFQLVGLLGGAVCWAPWCWLRLWSRGHGSHGQALCPALGSAWSLFKTLYSHAPCLHSLTCSISLSKIINLLKKFQLTNYLGSMEEWGNTYIHL